MLQDELSSVRQQQKRLVNHLLLEEIDPSTFAETSTELRDREAKLKLQIDGSDKERHEIIDIAVKAFELSQNLRAKWFEADYAAKRRILEIIYLNWTLDGVTLVPTMRKPFDMLAEGLVWKNSRDDRTPIELFLRGGRHGPCLPEAPTDHNVLRHKGLRHITWRRLDQNESSTSLHPSMGNSRTAH